MWRRLGYPFQSLVPSLATAIGSSADRPEALAELMGIIVNDGVRQPTVSMAELHFARGTPFETLLEPNTQVAERLLPAELTRLVREALVDAVESGTALRARNAFVLPDGTRLTVGGKTGTGDNRRESYGRGGRLLSSQAINRTASFVFFVDDRFYGVVTAHVAGADADNYAFTSSLPVQVLKTLAPTLYPLVAPDSVPEEPAPGEAPLLGQAQEVAEPAA